MTTVAWRDGVMAADTLADDRGARTYRHKLFRVGDDVVGCAGTVADWLVFVDWYRAGADVGRLPAFRQYGSEDGPDFEVLVDSAAGLICWGQHFQPWPVQAPFWAIGSGRDAALAAMHMGATARRAVEIAALVDVRTGGEVQVVERLKL